MTIQIELSIEEKTEIGRTICHLLELKKIRNHEKHDRYYTAWGDKTCLGIYETVKRVIEEEIKTV